MAKGGKRKTGNDSLNNAKKKAIKRLSQTKNPEDIANIFSNKIVPQSDSELETGVISENMSNDGEASSDEYESRNGIQDIVVVVLLPEVSASRPDRTADAPRHPEKHPPAVPPPPLNP